MKLLLIGLQERPQQPLRLLASRGRCVYGERFINASFAAVRIAGALIRSNSIEESALRTAKISFENSNAGKLSTTRIDPILH